MDYKSIRSLAKIFLILFALLVISTTGYSQDLQEKEWTVMIFMAADNDLESGTSVDINEIEKYGSTPSINFVAQIDRSGEFSDDSELKWSGSRRFYVIKDRSSKKMSSPSLQDLGKVDTASPEALTDFVKWAKTNYPAKRYALILWNHGTGWKEIQPSMMEGPGTETAPDMNFEMSDGLDDVINNISYNISYDFSSKTSMDIPTLRETLAEITEILGQPLDLLGFDACLMQMAEVAYAAAPFAKYQVGSPDLEPEKGWPYDFIAAGLTKKPKMEAKELGSLIVSAYKKSYSSGSQGNKAVVLSLLDLGKAQDFKDSIDRFCHAVRKNISDIDKIEKAQEVALKYSYGDYIDLGHFLYTLCKSSIKAETRAAATALYKTVIGEKGKGGFVEKFGYAGEKFRPTRGLSIFFPKRQGFRTYKNRYKRLSFCTETEWFEFLREVSAPGIPYLKIEDVILEDKNKDGRIAAGEEVSLKLTIRNLGRAALKTATVSCSTNSKLLGKTSFTTKVSNLPGPGKTEVVNVLTFKVSENADVHTEIPLQIYIRGKGIPVSTIKTSFYIKEPFSSTGHALLVVTDNFSPSSTVAQEMLQDAKVKFDIWDRMLEGDVKPEVLKRYLNGWVIFLSQDSSPDQSITEEEISSLDQFLNSGGRLVLSGQDFGFTLRESDFLAKKCKAAFVQDDVNIHVVTGSNSFARGASFQIFGGNGANNQKWPDEIDALQGGQVIMKYEAKTRIIADEREMNGPNFKDGSLTRGIKSSGGAAVKVIDGYRVILFSFGIESISDRKLRTRLIQEVADIMQPSMTSELRNFSEASSRRASMSSMSAREMESNIDLLSGVENRLMKNIKLSIEKNPENGQKILEHISNMSESNNESMKNLEKNVKSLLEFNQQHGTLNRR